MKATRQKPAPIQPPDTIHLEMSIDEARLLKSLTANIGGPSAIFDLVTAVNNELDRLQVPISQERFKFYSPDRDCVMITPWSGEDS
jgi:hypothetical protein